MLAIHGRTHVFVDGFNLYHGIKSIPRHKWLDIKALCGCYIPPHLIETIQYFTAFAFHAPENTVSRHRKYLQALRDADIKVTMGRFKEKQIYCKAICHELFISHEEKETDVNIAIAIVEEAVLDAYDSAVIVSGDTDILPALKAARRHGKKVYALFPPHRRNQDLARFCDDSARIRTAQIERCIFPNPVILRNGTEVWRPDTWI